MVLAVYWLGRLRRTRKTNLHKLRNGLRGKSVITKVVKTRDVLNIPASLSFASGIPVFLHFIPCCKQLVQWVSRYQYYSVGRGPPVRESSSPLSRVDNTPPIVKLPPFNQPLCIPPRCAGQGSPQMTRYS